MHSHAVLYNFPDYNALNDIFTICLVDAALEKLPKKNELLFQIMLKMTLTFLLDFERILALELFYKPVDALRLFDVQKVVTS